MSKSPLTERNVIVPKILIVDDETDFQALMEIILERAGYETLAAADGLEALALTRQYRPDLILADYNMPRMDGGELCQHIKSNLLLRHIPVVLQIAAGSHLQQHWRELGADAVLLKPASRRKILELVAHLLGIEAPVLRIMTGVLPDSQSPRTVFSWPPYEAGL